MPPSKVSPIPPARWGKALPVLLLAGSWLLAAGNAQSQTSGQFVPTFSTNPRIKQQVEKMNRLAGLKQWDECLAAYQQLVDDPRDPVLARDEEFLVGVRYLCHQFLGNQPAAARQRYRQLYDGEARKLYEKAVAEQSVEVMRDLYSRYRYSTEAPRALLWLANRALDEGRVEYARVAYSRLARDPAVTVNVLLRWALAADAAGRPAEARQVLDRIRKDYAQAPTQLMGQPSNGVQAADAVSKSLRPAPQQPAGFQWTAFTGEQGDRRLPAALSGSVRKLWDYTYPFSTDSVGSIQSRAGFSTRFSSRFAGLLSFPLVRDGRVWSQGARNMVSLNLESGRQDWDQTDFTVTRDEEPDQAAANVNPRFSSSYSMLGRTLQAAPEMKGHLLAARVPLVGSERSSNRWPADYALGVWDARSGRQLWRRVAGGDPRGVYFNLPRLEGGAVFSGAASTRGGITEYSAVALDASTGEPLWTTYLGAGSDPVSVADGSPAAVRDGVVWIESTLYTLNALDLLTGEIRLIYRYDPGRRSGYGRGFNSAPTVTNEPISAIAMAPRITIEQREVTPLVFVPRWGTDAVCLDSESGRMLWSSPKAPLQGSFGVLFGVDQRRAYICGDHLQALNLADGSREWTWEPPAASGSLGYAALAGDRIYAVYEGKVTVRSAEDGKEVESIDTQEVLGESPGYTSILPLPGVLLVNTREKLYAFGPRAP